MYCNDHKRLLVNTAALGWGRNRTAISTDSELTVHRWALVVPGVSFYAKTGRSVVIYPFSLLSTSHLQFWKGNLCSLGAQRYIYFLWAVYSKMLAVQFPVAEKLSAPSSDISMREHAEIRNVFAQTNGSKYALSIKIGVLVSWLV